MPVRGGCVVADADRVTRLERGSLFAGYRIEGQLDRGGMGVVYKAADPDLDRTVALKIIAPEHTQNPDAVARFKTEARLAASIEHPNIVPIHRGGEFEGVLYLAMRFVPGTNLRKVVDAGQLDLHRIGRIITAVAAALDAAHERGLVHRDVKPGNILLSGEGEHEHVYLTDFGLTKRLGSAGSLTRPGAWVGTPDYVAPEQIQAGKVDGRADVYSLGCVLYEMLTGDVAFPKENDMAKLWAHVTDAAARPGPEAPRSRAGLQRRGGKGHREGPGRALPAGVRSRRRGGRGHRPAGRTACPRRPPGHAGRGRGGGCRGGARSLHRGAHQGPGPFPAGAGAGRHHGLHAHPARRSAARCHRRAACGRGCPAAGRHRPAAGSARRRPGRSPAAGRGPSRRFGRRRAITQAPLAAGGRDRGPRGRGRGGSGARHRLFRRRFQEGPRRAGAGHAESGAHQQGGRPRQHHASAQWDSGHGHAPDQRTGGRRAPRDAHPRGREGRVPDRGRRSGAQRESLHQHPGRGRVLRSSARFPDHEGGHRRGQHPRVPALPDDGEHQVHAAQ